MVRIGTSGWQYKDWRGRFYPKGVPQSDWLSFYASRFRTVEVNNSFYRLPEAETFRRWREQTPAGFVVAVKASRFLTHLRRLRDPEEPFELLWSRATELGDRLGPILFQLPPRFPADPDRLRALLRVLPRSAKAAFEFRDPSWHEARVFEHLEGANAALVWADRPRAHIDLPITADWAYIRFHQGRIGAPGYTRRKLRRWADRIADLPVREAWIYFNNDTGGAAPRDAQTLRSMLEERADG
jgi:uncharacterized protein YecE (DUF72 family)